MMMMMLGSRLPGACVMLCLVPYHDVGHWESERQIKRMFSHGLSHMSIHVDMEQCIAN